MESLQVALERLPDEVRRCFRLRYGRGYGAEAIAILMKLPVERVRSCLAQALLSLGLGGRGEVS
jgi:DNA-directed RNA polymerase specialized sigma24 family protein